MTSGRSTKLTPKLQEDFCALIAKGVPDKRACEAVHITYHAFYWWMLAGEALIEGRDHPRIPATPERRAAVVKFVNAVKRARAEANVVAIEAFRSGLVPSETIERTSETVTETRLDAQGNPYEYTKTVRRRTVRVNPPEWRAGAEWVRRRDPEHWGIRDNIEVTGRDGGAIQVDVGEILEKLREWEAQRRAQTNSPTSA